MIRRVDRALIALFLPLALVACGSGNDADRNLDSLDAELSDGNSAGNSRDPALMAALQDQIMVDPALAGQANHDAIRPPAQPYSAPVPLDGATGAAPVNGSTASETLKHAPEPSGSCTRCGAAQEAMTLGALAARQGDAGTHSCARGVQYSTGWAQRLPRDLPLYPDASVSEAAGSEGGACALRIVSFASNAPLQTVIDWYYTRATDAGYSAEHQADGDQHVLAGTRNEAAFALFITRRDDGGTDVDMVVNNGN